MGRYIRYWYTYRTLVAVLMAIVLSGVMYWLYTQQLLCDAKPGSCFVYLAGHPEDRLVGRTNPDSNVVIVGLDNQSVKTIGTFPVPRDRYATVLTNLEKAGAAVVAFDIGFPDPRDPSKTLFVFDGKASQIVLTPGIYHTFITAADNLKGGVFQYDFQLIATAFDTETSSEGRTGTINGTITTTFVQNNNLPVGHTIVKGVDIYDGHLTVTSSDVAVPGRGPSSLLITFSGTSTSLPSLSVSV